MARPGWAERTSAALYLNCRPVAARQLLLRALRRPLLLRQALFSIDSGISLARHFQAALIRGEACSRCRRVAMPRPRWPALTPTTEESRRACSQIPTETCLG